MEDTTPPNGAQPEQSTRSVTDTHTVVLSSREAQVPPPTTRYDGVAIKDSAVAFIISLALTGLVVTTTLTEWSHRDDLDTEHISSTPITGVVAPVLPDGANPFERLSLEAKSVAVYDVYADTFLYVRNADTVRPLASLTKIMTGLIASENANENQPIVISPYAIETEGDSGLFANETWRLKDLLAFTLVTSSNDGADAIAASIGSLWDLDPGSTDEYMHVERFVDRMNRRAEEIGMKQTHFTNPSGLDESYGTYGGSGTAEDVARLLAYAWTTSPDVLTDTTELEKTYVSEDGFVHAATNTNRYVYSFPGLLGSKTGYTDQAGANLVLVYDAGLDHPVVVVVLGSSHEGRFSDASSLIYATRSYITSGWYAYEVAGSTPTL